MNGLANAILSLLLGWLRTLITRFWNIITSEDGSAFLTFLSNNWLKILLILCVGGFVIDKVIYLIRWQPFRVWQHRRRRRKGNADEPIPEADYSAHQPPLRYDSYEPAAYQPPLVTQPAQPIQEPQWYPEGGDTRRADRPNLAQATNIYTPPARSTFQDIEPVFEPEQDDWHQADHLVTSPLAPFLQPAQEDEPVREPQVSAQYLKDMQDGYARPLPPEQLYGAAKPNAESTPVHPGLDTSVFFKNVGLEPQEQPAAEAVQPQNVTPAVITTAPVSAAAQPETKKPRNPFLNLARLIADDEDRRPSLQDLQPKADAGSTFHEPVFPQYLNEEEHS